MAKTYEIAFQLASKMSSSFGSTFGSANDRLQRLNRIVSSLKVDIRELAQAEKTGKVSAEQYAQSHSKITKELEKAERAQRNLAIAVNTQKKVDDSRAQARQNMINAAETAVVLGAPIAAAIRFESSMADVRKVVDFDTPQQFKAMEKDILSLSKRIPMTADGLAQIVAAGGQAGIAQDELIAYAEAAAKMGVAFDISADEAGQTMAQWRSAFKMNQAQVITLADQINYLSNTTAASAPKISDVVRRIGPLGEVGGAAASQIAALGATMVGAGVSEEVSATGIKNLILSLTAGEAATKGQAEAFNALGMDAKQMAKMMQEDAQGAIVQVFRALQKLPKEKQAAVLSELFGKESIGAIAPLLTKLDALQDNFKKVADKTQYAGSMEEEFEERSKTTANQLQLLRSRMEVLEVGIGSILLPPLNDLIGFLSRATDKVIDFSEKHPGLTKVIVTAAAAVLGFSVATAALKYAAGAVISPFVNFWAWTKKVEMAEKLAAAKTKAWTAARWTWNAAMTAGKGSLSVGRIVAYHGASAAVSLATKSWTAAQWLLNAALNANPIGIVVMGIAGLVTGLVLLYKRSEKARAIMNEMWTGLKTGAAIAINFVIDRINALIDKLNKIKVPNWVPGIGGKGVNVDKINRVNVPGHAEGGIFNRPHLAWFAERGPEAAIPLDGSPQALGLWAQAGQALGVGGGGGGDINVTFAPKIYAPGGDPATIRQALKAAGDDLKTQLAALTRQERRLSYA